MINVAKDFTRFPSGRWKKNGNTSGEAFRNNFIEPAIKNRTPIAIDLDGVIGYGSSFLEEAFGGSIRSTRINKSEFNKIVTLISENKTLIKEIEKYLEDASKSIARR
ncbi:STAS-like domain-containing protein [Alcaligenes nematophilus]|uniref:STAS-like domain-containing protein n=1 Tax=Alcaligenes nematophilus TaxID=2994643 RepID=UPI0038515F6D